MKTRIQNFALITLASVLTTLSVAHAKGGNVGSGGIAFVCRQADGTIGRAHLVDLIEAESIDQRVLIDDALSKEAALIQVLENLDRHGVRGTDVIRSELLAGLKAIRRKILPLGFIPSSALKRLYFPISLPDPQDYDLRVTVPGCTPEAIGLYDDLSDTLHLNQQVYDALSGRDQLAFEIHEVLFKFARLTFAGLGNSSAFQEDLMLSNRTRELVGALFSDPAKTPKSGLTPDPALGYYRRIGGVDPGKEIEYKYAMLTRRMACSYARGKTAIVYPFLSSTESKRPFPGVGFAQRMAPTSKRDLFPDFDVYVTNFAYQNGKISVSHRHQVMDASSLAVLGEVSRASSPDVSISDLIESDDLAFENTAHSGISLPIACQVVSSANELKP